MADRPIIFSAPMVRALLDGRKSQTRRLLKRTQGAAIDRGFDAGSLRLRYTPGDRLWVKEAWRAPFMHDSKAPRDLPSQTVVEYEASDGLTTLGRLRSPIHMPRWASRLTLTVTDVRVHLVQDISTKSCMAEGIAPDLARVMAKVGSSEMAQRHAYHDAYVAAFATLWNSLHGPGAWDANPWVAAISFSVTRGNIDQIGGANG